MTNRKNKAPIAERDIIRNRANVANRSAMQRSLLRYTAGKIPHEDLYLKMQAQDYKCMYCKDQISFHTCHIDHVFPLNKGGEHYLYNVALTCTYCNLSKGIRTLRRFCQKMKFDYDAIVQELADINQRLHERVFGNDYRLRTTHYNPYERSVEEYDDVA